jgi:hypothetical protein
MEVPRKNRKGFKLEGMEFSKGWQFDAMIARETKQFR